MLVCILTGEVNFDPLVKVESVRFLHYKIIIFFSFVSFGGESLRQCISCYSSNIHLKVLTSTGDFCVNW